METEEIKLGGNVKGSVTEKKDSKTTETTTKKDKKQINERHLIRIIPTIQEIKSHCHQQDYNKPINKKNIATNNTATPNNQHYEI